VMVNILAPVIITLMERDNLVDYVGINGTMILSGIIEEQKKSVLSTLKTLGRVLKEVYQMNDWVCLVA
jgi:ribosomal protein L11 methylase PrmA